MLNVDSTVRSEDNPMLSQVCTLHACLKKYTHLKSTDTLDKQTSWYKLGPTDKFVAIARNMNYSTSLHAFL